MLSNEVWCITHWYLFALPLGLIALVYTAFLIRRGVLIRKLCRLEASLFSLDARHLKSTANILKEQRLFDEIDRHEEKVATAEEILSSIVSVWIPAIALVSVFIFFCCAVAATS